MWRAARNRILAFASASSRPAASTRPACCPATGRRDPGYEAIAGLPRLPDATAIVAANDQIALGAMLALKERGVRIPDDVSVVGIDDIPESAYFDPPLTTLHIDFEMQGRASVHKLIAQIERTELRQVTVPPPRLVVRRSSGPPPGVVEHRSDAERPRWPREARMAIDVALAVDIGGTKVDAALVDGVGRIVPGSRHREPTGADQSPATFSAALASVCSRAADAATVAGPIGSSASASAPPGPLLRAARASRRSTCPASGTSRSPPPSSQAAPGAPVRIALDGTCITLAEHRFGALRGVRNGIAMVVSTGIGGGIVLDGRIVRGHAGNAGHVGQVWVRRPDPAAPVRATVEAVASGPATVRWANEHGWPGADGRALAADYAAGHPLAVGPCSRSASAVGHAIAGYAALLDLEVVAIGGGFSRVADDYVELVEAAAHELAMLPAARVIRVVRAALGDDAPLVGAAMLVLDGR